MLPPSCSVSISLQNPERGCFGTGLKQKTIVGAILGRTVGNVVGDETTAQSAALVGDSALLMSPIGTKRTFHRPSRNVRFREDFLISLLLARTQIYSAALRFGDS
jgi:hypothetical protein